MMHWVSSAICPFSDLLCKLVSDALTKQNAFVPARDHPVLICGAPSVLRFGGNMLVVVVEVMGNLGVRDL